MLMVLLSKVSHANADMKLKPSRCRAIMLCPVARRIFRTEDDTDDMQV